MTQPYGCDTFEYCALSTRLCNVYVGPSTNYTESDQLCNPNPIMKNMHNPLTLTQLDCDGTKLNNAVTSNGDSQ